jgi:hypothetical protein
MTCNEQTARSQPWRDDDDGRIFGTDRILAVKIDAPGAKVSVEVSSAQGGDRRRQRVRIEHLEPKRRTA